MPTPRGTWSRISKNFASTWASTAGRSSADPGAPPSRSPTPKPIPTASPNSILRGIFLLRKQEIDWFYQRGASVLYPDAWEPYLAHIPTAERADLLSAYYRRLTSDDPAVRLAAAKIWSGWEGATSKLLPDAAFTGHYEEDEFALAFARIEVHYFHQGDSSRPTTSCCATPRASATSPA